MIRPKKIRLVGNPRKKRPAAKARKIRRSAPASAKRRNPAFLLSVGPLNPQRSSKMRKKSKKRAPKRKNPALFAFRKKAKRIRRRRNPSLLSRPVNVLKSGAFALGGLIFVRQIPQMVLKDKNTGLMGYAANLVAVFIAAAGAGKFLGKEAGQAVGIGGGLYLANRIISENFSPIPKALALSGLGDAAAAGTMGALVPASFAHPVARNADGSVIVPPAYLDAAKNVAVSVMSGSRTMSGRRAA